MGSFVVEGGHKLSGTIRPQGAKNEALEVISAVLLTDEEVVISNVPEILTKKKERMRITAEFTIFVPVKNNRGDEVIQINRIVFFGRAEFREVVSF